MTKPLSIRPDAEVVAALSQLGDTYGNTTDTLKTAILHLAEEKRREELRAEVRRVAADAADRAEMMDVLAHMETLHEG